MEGFGYPKYGRKQNCWWRSLFCHLGCPTASRTVQWVNGHPKEHSMMNSHITLLSHEASPHPPLQGTNDKSPFCSFCGWSDSYEFFEGTSLTCHGIGVTKIQDQIYINAMFGRISPTYIWSWDQLWAEVTEVSLQKKRSFSSTSKGLIKFDLSLLHEAWKINNPIMARYVSLFFHSVSSAEPKKTRFRGEAWLIAKTKIEGGKQKPLPIYRGEMLVSGRVLYTFRVFCPFQLFLSGCYFKL